MIRKRKIHQGGAWKVAYADLFTAMMALFLVLWLTAQDTRIKESVERAFRNPYSAVNKESTGIIPNENTSASGHQPQAGRFEAANALETEMLRHISEDLARILDNTDEERKSVQLELTPDGLRINVFDRSHKPIFESDSDTFTSYGAWVFSTLAWEISRYQTFQIELEGHTEANSQTGREAHSKWELSAERANAARRKLLQSGVPSRQIFRVSGFADTQPMAHMLPGSETNRRVTVLLRVQNPTLQTTTPPSGHDQPS